MKAFLLALALLQSTPSAPTLLAIALIDCSNPIPDRQVTIKKPLRVDFEDRGWRQSIVYDPHPAVVKLISQYSGIEAVYSYVSNFDPWAVSQDSGLSRQFRLLSKLPALIGSSYSSGDGADSEYRRESKVEPADLDLSINSSKVRGLFIGICAWTAALCLGSWDVYRNGNIWRGLTIGALGCCALFCGLLNLWI